MIENPVAEYLAKHAGETIPMKRKKEYRDDLIRSDYDELIPGRTAGEVVGMIIKRRKVSESTVRRALRTR